MLPAAEASAVMKGSGQQTSSALHTNPIATDALKPAPAEGQAVQQKHTKAAADEEPLEPLVALRYTHAVEGYVDTSRKLASAGSVFGWDDIVVLLACGRTYQELKMQSTLKYSPRDVNLSLGH